MGEYGDDQTYADVVNLGEACANAASIGKNGKQLVLELAGRLADEEDFLFSTTQGDSVALDELDPPQNNESPPAPLRVAADPPASPQKITNYDELFEVIPMPERPLIEYNPRMTKIPRLSRQFGLQTLTGKLLALLLEVQGVIPKQVFKEVETNEELRKLATAIALVQEHEMYLKCASKLTYSSEVAKFQASKAHVPKEFLEKLSVTFTSSSNISNSRKRKASNLEDSALKATVNGTTPMHKSDMAAIDKCFDSSSDDEGNTHPAKASCTNDHDAPVELPTASTSILQFPLPRHDSGLSEAEQQLESKGSGEVPHNEERRECLSRVSSRPGIDSSAQDGGDGAEQAASVPPLYGKWATGRDGVDRSEPRSRVGFDAKEQSEAHEERCGDDIQQGGSVRDQVSEYVRALLEPLSRARVLSAEVYKNSLRKTVDKVMMSHEDESTADFLIREGSKIRSLVERYVEYCKAKGM